ncbi:hypothetical protein PF008_g13793 [Phytophthora fragariae]|uniref:Reverse transcriptase Ty1/copia-type domain-containing protein n=1 Tax=Phytophthora fragariae TaxID=53985 RepID=A0A6G0RKB6_9STRA|nr:hypothetical protein PF008_g13793 [Phytophthora fragariae]
MVTLNGKYQVKDLGEPQQFLGMRIRRENGAIHLSQSNYVDELLYRFAMDASKPQNTPMVPKTRLDKLTDEPSAEEVAEMQAKPFHQVVGSLLYLARVSRPDLSFTINQLARHCATPRKEAWTAAKYALRYLRKTKDIELVLRPIEDGMRIATDADWANDLQDRKSVSGFVVYLFGCPVHWGSSKQSVIALSSTTAEFIAASDGLQQAEWIKLVAMEVLTATTQDGPADLPLTLQIDNQSTIKRVKKDGTSGAQKAVDIRFHCLKEAWKTGFVALEYVPSHENPADLLTKALSRHELAHKRALCGMSQ